MAVMAFKLLRGLETSCHSGLAVDEIQTNPPFFFVLFFSLLLFSGERFGVGRLQRRVGYLDSSCVCCAVGRVLVATIHLFPGRNANHCARNAVTPPPRVQERGVEKTVGFRELHS